MKEFLVDEHWHLDKKVNVGHILTTIALLLAGIAVLHGIDNRLTALEVRVEETTRQNMEYQRQTTDALVRIEAKLDRAIEREVDDREVRR